MELQQCLEFLLATAKTVRLSSMSITQGTANRYECMTRTISNTGTWQQQANSPKLDRLVQMVQATPFPQVIYSHFLEKGIHAVSALLPQSLRIQVITGATPAPARTRAISDYNQGKVDVLLISDASNTGIDLHNTVAIHLLEPHLNFNSEQQTIHRVARLNSHACGSAANVHVFKYISTFPPAPSLKRVSKAQRALLTSAFAKHVFPTQDTTAAATRLSDEGFDVIKEMTRLVAAQDQATIDEKLERTNLSKHELLQPYIAAMRDSTSPTS
jgi:superfamily II DNA/RNA helicase